MDLHGRQAPINILESQIYESGVTAPQEHRACAIVLEQFLQYLESRLQTEGFDLFRRYLTDYFHDKRETSLDHCIYYGVGLVVIKPFENVRQEAQLLAKDLLNAQKSLYSSEIPLIFQHIASIVCTRNITVLADIFEDFMYNRESTLLDFIYIGSFVISIIPEPICGYNQWLQMKCTNSNADAINRKIRHNKSKKHKKKH